MPSFPLRLQKWRFDTLLHATHSVQYFSILRVVSSHLTDASAIAIRHHTGRQYVRQANLVGLRQFDLLDTFRGCLRGGGGRVEIRK
jgi:hypothetical protein